SGAMLVALSTGTSFLTPKTWVKFAAGTSFGSLQVGDFNNDGKADIAYFYNVVGTTAIWGVARSTGAAFTAGAWGNLNNFGTGDFNGDGNTDIAHFYNINAHAKWYVRTSSGATATTSFCGDMPNAGVCASQMAGDFNNDGKDDLVSYNSTLHQWWVSLTNSGG